MQDLLEGFELNDTRIPATFSLHMDWTRKVTWWFQDIQDLDLLYYAQKYITPEEKTAIEWIILGNTKEINRILSSYI